VNEGTGKEDNLCRCQGEVTRCSVRPYSTATDSRHDLSIICPSPSKQFYIRTGILAPIQNRALQRNTNPDLMQVRIYISKSFTFWDITCSPLKIIRCLGGTCRSRAIAGFAFCRFIRVSCLAYCSTLKMEAVCFSETSVDFQLTARRRYIPEKKNLFISTSVKISNPRIYISFLQLGLNAFLRYHSTFESHVEGSIIYLINAETEPILNAPRHLNLILWHDMYRRHCN
jgi:hypothetical protein